MDLAHRLAVQCGEFHVSHQWHRGHGEMPTQRCSTWSVPRAQHPRMHIRSEATTRGNAVERVIDVRKQMNFYRDARRALAAKLRAVEDERRRWWRVCVGDECEIHAADLHHDADSLRKELMKHREVLEELDDIQREIILQEVEAAAFGDTV
jgi:hypothetical protein